MNTTSGWGAIGQNQDPQLDWSNCDGVRFWMKGSGTGGHSTSKFTDNGDDTTAMAQGGHHRRHQRGHFSSSILQFTNGYDWNGGGATLDLTKVKAFLFSGFKTDNGGAKIDQFQLSNQ